MSATTAACAASRGVRERATKLRPQLLAVRRAGRGGGGGGHPVPLAVHPGHVGVRLEGVGQRLFRRADATTCICSRRSRFLWAVVRTLYFTTARSSCPCCSASGRPSASPPSSASAARRARIFILPMMATPVAIALVWTMMFHPQLGVLNYLLSLVGLPPSSWVYRQQHGDPHPGDGGNLAVDAAGDADRAGRHLRPADRSV